MIKKRSILFALEYLRRFLTACIQKFYKDRCLSKAASLAFITIISVIPLLIVLLAFLLSFDSIRDIVIKATNEDIIPFLLPATPSDNQLISDYLFTFTNNVKSLRPISILFLFVMAIDVIYILEDSIQEIWYSQKRKSFYEKLLIYWCIITIVPFAILLSFYVHSWFPESFFLSFIIPWIITWLFFSVIYLFIHKNNVTRIHAMLVGLVISLLWGSVKFLFTLYLTTIGNQTVGLLYGSLYLIPIAIGWIYYSYAVFLLGLEMMYLLEHPEVYRYSQSLLQENKDNWNLFITLSSLIYIYQKFEQGKGASSLVCLAKKNQLSQNKMYSILERLRDKNLISKITEWNHRNHKQNISYLPKTPMHTISIHSLLESSSQKKHCIPDLNTISNHHMSITKEIFRQITQCLDEYESKVFNNRSLFQLYQKAIKQKKT